jgi:hypothetical protein
MPFWPQLLPADKPKFDWTQGQLIYINFYINLLILPKPFNGGFKTNMHKAARHSNGMVSLIQAAGGVSGSITMVVVFVGCFLCCCGWTCDVTRPSYVKIGTEITFR